MNSCSRYTVFTKDNASNKIDLMSSDETITVLVNHISCFDCLAKIVLKTNQDIQIRVVFLVEKNGFSRISKIKEYEEVLAQPNVSAYFQYSKRKDYMSYRLTNRLFKRHHKELSSPIVIVKDSGEVRELTYTEYMRE